MKNFCFILVLLAQGAIAQPRDTSFSLQATFLKESKKFPFISIASPPLSKKTKMGRDIIYRRLGHRNLSLDIFYPGKKGNEKRPGVLLIFGGGWRSGDKTHNHAMATTLANKGYVAVSAEYRLSPEAKYPAAVYDLKAAIRWMRHHANEYGLDTSRIAVMGCSAGGQLASLIGVTNNNSLFEDSIGDQGFSSRVQAVVNIDGILAFKHPESSEGASASQWLGGSWEQNPTAWKEASPLTHTGKQMAPILFVNSSIPRFHAGRDDLVSEMKALGIYSEVHTLEDTPHPFWFFHPWFDPLMKYTLAFLDKIFRK
jgi:pectinesterase